MRMSKKKFPSKGTEYKANELTEEPTQSPSAKRQRPGEAVQWLCKWIDLGSDASSIIFSVPLYDFKQVSEPLKTSVSFV